MAENNAVPSPDDTLEEAALMYAKCGWTVFPVHSAKDRQCSCGNPNCEDIGKHPRSHHGHKDATSDPAQIEKWWDEWPDANVAVATGPSGLVVLDVDVGNGKPGWASLKAIEDEFGPLPPTFSTRTGGGGEHRFFRAPSQPVRNCVGLRPGIDIRANGGYVILPPSTHLSGGNYEFVEGPSSNDLADTPGWLVQLIGDKSVNGKRPRQRTTPVDTISIPGRIPEFERNATLTSMAGTMRAVGFELPAIRAALLEHNKSHCDDPLEDAEVEGIARSIVNYKVGVPRAGGIFWPRELDKRLQHRPNELRVFMYLLRNANWMPKHGLGTGEIRVSARDLGGACAVDQNNKRKPLASSTVAAALKNLRTWGLIEVLGTDPETHVRIVNYEQYRGVPVGRQVQL